MILDHTKRAQFFFEEIAKIPHGSKNEKALSDYLVSFAKEHGLEHIQDEMNNVIIWKQAQHSNATDYLMMQAHIDMVCEKNKDVDHDFEKDPIQLMIQDGWVTAKGTTLGADDGFGVAMMMALLEDKTSVMPPIECIFTVEEEIGLFGAAGIDPKLLRAKRMISLDGGGENFTLTTSCGGQRGHMTFNATKEAVSASGLHIAVRGLHGGHSGGSIDKGLGNSLVIMARLLNEIKSLNPRIGIVEGGSKDNAIPRESDAFVAVDATQAKAMLLPLIDAIKAEYAHTEEGFFVELKDVTVDGLFDQTFSKNLIELMLLMPHGVLSFSPVFDNLVEASQNFGVMSTEGNDVKVTVSMRSSIDSQLDYMANVLVTITHLYGGIISLDSRYPGWAYVAESPIRDLFVETYESMFDKKVQQGGAHGGLETGIFKSYVPEMDIITMGPVTEGAHTPEERMNLASYDRVYDVLKEMLRRMGA